MKGQPTLTRNQQRGLQALSGTTGPLSAYALMEHAGFSGPSQVYRALDKLIGLGFALRLESLNAYISCSVQDPSYPTAFAICDQCGHIDQVVDGPLAEHLQRLADRQAFELGRAVVEAHGICSECCASRLVTTG